MLDDKNYKLLKESYKLLKEDMKANSYYETTSNLLFDDIRMKIIESKNLQSTVDEVIEIFLSDRAEAISSSGIGKMNKASFHEFLQNSKTREKVYELIELVNENEITYKLVSPIKDIGLLEHLEDFHFIRGGNRPFVFVNRIFVMLFPEIMTVTVDRTKLNSIGKKLGMKDSASRHFVTSQYLIKDIVNDFIKEEGLQEETLYIKCAISEWLL